jgi:N-acetylmuramoyl-L-alanine amidase
MQPEPVPLGDSDHRSSIEALALTLLTLGGDQSVRVLEALAAALVNRARQHNGDHGSGLCEPPPPDFRHPTAAHVTGGKLELCHRIARRALRGSLADPTVGAGAFHRLEDNPAWARDLLPVATFGSFLFYQLPPSE